jgi:predicted RNase H-like nuclease (RuvC/YqgF family)
VIILYLTTVDNSEVQKVFALLRKLDEEQNSEVIYSAEQCANLAENIKEENPNQQTITQEPRQNEEENILSILEALEGQEQVLITEKSQLVSMEETLTQRIREEIEIRRHRIENLKHEIPELKQRCEVLAKALDIPVQK